MITTCRPSSARLVSTIRRGLLRATLAWLGSITASSVSAGSSGDTALIAVSSNFTQCFHKLEQAFESQSSHSIDASSGSTGKLYAQIRQSAPFDALLAADQQSVQQLADHGLVVSGTRFTYAEGRLALWSAKNTLAALAEKPLNEVLNSPLLGKLALANERLAPYGRAAAAVIAGLGVHPDTTLVTGENISQTYQFVYSKNVGAGFVAAAQLQAHSTEPEGLHWPVESALHPPIRQDAALLQHGEDNLAAQELLTFMQSNSGAQIIRSCGYDLMADAG